MIRLNRISLFILSLMISLFFTPSTIKAQGGKEPIIKDSTAMFKGVAVSFDLVGAGQLLLSDYGQYEAAVRVNLKDKYFPIAEIGYGKCDATDETTNNTYKTDAPYIRVGCDFNILKNKHDIYRFYLGGRYAFSSYKYDVTNTTLTDPVWGDKAGINSTNNKGNQHWLEFAAGIDVKISGPIHLGWSFRYKQRLFNKNGDVGDAYYVPGYGRGGRARLGGTFNVIFEL